MSTAQDGLQLRVLTSYLVPGALLEERDEEWTFQSLLQEITAELSDVPKPAERPKPAVKPKDAVQQKNASKHGSAASGKDRDGTSSKIPSGRGAKD